MRLLGKQAAARGVTLIELAILMLFISLALFPIIRQMGGKSNTGTIGPEGSQLNSVNAVNRTVYREAMAANDIMERILSGDRFEEDPPRFPWSGGPDAIVPEVISIKRYDHSYGQPLYYNWQVRDMSFPFVGWMPQTGSANTSIPQGNQLVMVTVQIRRERALTSPVVAELSGMVLRNRADWEYMHGWTAPSYDRSYTGYMYSLITDMKRYYYRGLASF